MLLNLPENVNNTGFKNEHCPYISWSTFYFFVYLKLFLWFYTFYCYRPQIFLFTTFFWDRSETLKCVVCTIYTYYTIYNPFPLLVDRRDVKRENLRINDARRRPISSQSGPTDVKTQNSFISLFCFVSPGFMADFVVGRKLKRSHAFH